MSDDELLAQSSWREQLAGHSGGDADTLVAICDAFLDEVPSLVRRIGQALQDGDPRALKTASHTLKSCLNYVAVPEDVQFVAEVEQQSDDPTLISEQRFAEVEIIANRWHRCVQTLRKETLG